LLFFLRKLEIQGLGFLFGHNDAGANRVSRGGAVVSALTDSFTSESHRMITARNYTAYNKVTVLVRPRILGHTRVIRVCWLRKESHQSPIGGIIALEHNPLNPAGIGAEGELKRLLRLYARKLQSTFKNVLLAEEGGAQVPAVRHRVQSQAVGCGPHPVNCECAVLLDFRPSAAIGRLITPGSLQPDPHLLKVKFRPSGDAHPA